MNKYRYISCTVFVILDILSAWLCARFENGYPAILTTMLGIAYLVWEISQIQINRIKIASVIFIAISVIGTAIITWYAKFENSSIFLIGFSIPVIFLTILLGYIAIFRCDEIKLKWTIPFTILPTLLTSLPAYLSFTFDLKNAYSLQLECAAIAVGDILYPIAGISCLHSLMIFIFSPQKKNSITGDWIISSSSFIWGLCNILNILYFFPSFQSAILTSILKTFNYSHYTFHYLILTGIDFFIITLIHTYIYLKKEISKKTSIFLTIILFSLIFGITYFYKKIIKEPSIQQTSYQNTSDSSSKKPSKFTPKTEKIDSDSLKTTSPEHSHSTYRIETPDEIMDEYDQNNIAADRKYRNNPIRISSTIKKIDTGLTGKPYIILEAPKHWHDLRANFDRSYTDALAQLRKDQTITLTCIGNYKYEVNDCSIYR